MAAPNLSDADSNPARSPQLVCDHIASGYFGKNILSDITFSIQQPGIYVVLGPNGAGKTTLFRTLAGILTPSAGTVQLDGAPIDAQASRNRIHFLSHVDGIPDALRVEEALRFYATVQGATSSDVERVVKLLDLEPLRRRFFSELSAGQKKRVSIARIFLRDRDVYLLDEPTANVDPKIANEIRDLVLDLSKNRLVLYSSHNLFEAREIGQFVIAIKDGRLALVQKMSELSMAHYKVGIRVLAGADRMPPSQRSGEYYIYELPGPQDVPKLMKELESQGITVREVKEMGNPLEELFA
ncbi:MAG: heme ABC exporter ATP-binding protein CcmA [Thermoplasmatota archaeon]